MEYNFMITANMTRLITHHKPVLNIYANPTEPPLAIVP